MSRTVVLWRHGRTHWNAANRFQGHSDIDLDDTGRDQAEAAAADLALLAPDAIVSSDLVRAASTADALARRTGLPVSSDPDLREAFADQWEGLTHDEIRQHDPDAFHRWHTEPGVRPGGGGETRSEVGTRVGEAVERHALAVPESATLVVVTHGGSARAAVCHLLQLPVLTWQRFWVLDNCGWAVLRLRDGRLWELTAYNRGSVAA